MGTGHTLTKADMVIIMPYLGKYNGHIVWDIIFAAVPIFRRARRSTKLSVSRPGVNGDAVSQDGSF